MRCGACVNRPVAYLRPQGEGGCLHHVEAIVGGVAKSLAIKEHRTCADQADPHCARCRAKADA